MRSLLLLFFLLSVFQTWSAETAATQGGVEKFGFGHPNSGTDDPFIATLDTNVVHISENSNWWLVMLEDGSLDASGSDTFDQVSDVPSGTNWVHSFAGWRHGIVVDSSGDVDEWGTPYGNTIADWEALRPAGVTNETIIQVAGGDDHSIALDDSGIVYTWGGRTEVTNHNEVITTATMIDSGWYAGIALLSDGTVVTFGTVSLAGQYITVPSGLSNATHVAASQLAFYAIQDGVPWGWGMPNTYGQFTFGAEATNIVSISGGKHHTIMARDDGAVLTYGDDGQGQVTIPSSLTNSVWVAGGRYSSFAIQTDTAGSSSGASKPSVVRHLRLK